MAAIAVEIDLADDVAREAETAGLLTPEALQSLVSAELRRRSETPLSTVEIQAEIDAYRREKRFADSFPASPAAAFVESDAVPPADPKAMASIALLRSWIATAPTDEEEIAEAEREFREFKRNMNRPRKEAGARLLFPEAE